MEKQLINLAQEVVAKYGGIVYCVKIDGKRWGTFYRSSSDLLPLIPPKQISLNDSYGIIIYSWSLLNPDQQTEILGLINKLK
jgi:hypothetical protein